MAIGSTEAAPAGAANGSMLASIAAAPAPTAAPSPAPVAEVKPSAPVAAPEGRFKLADDYASHASMRKFINDDGTVDPNVVAKSYLNLERMLGADKLTLPKDETDKDGWNAVYAKLGRPDTPEAYELKKPEKLPEGIAADESAEKVFRTLAHENGLNTRQAQAVYDAYLAHQQQAIAAHAQAMSKAREEGERAIAREYGSSLPEVQTVVRATMAQYADEEFVGFLNESGLGNDPRMMRMLAKMGKDLVGETKLKGRTGEPIKTTDQWLQEASDFRKANQAALFDAGHPDHKRLTAELQAKMDRAFPA